MCPRISEYGGKGYEKINGGYRITGTNRYVRIDLTDAAHGNTPNYHVYDNAKDLARNRRPSGKGFFDLKTGKALGVASVVGAMVLQSGIKCLDGFGASNSCMSWYKALEQGDVSGARMYLEDCSADILIKSGTAAGSLNAKMVLERITDSVESTVREYFPATVQGGV